MSEPETKLGHWLPLPRGPYQVESQELNTWQTDRPVKFAKALQIPSGQAHRSSLFPHTFGQDAAQPQKNRPSAARKPRFFYSMRVMGQMEAELAETQQSETRKENLSCALDQANLRWLDLPRIV